MAEYVLLGVAIAALVLSAAAAIYTYYQMENIPDPGEYKADVELTDVAPTTREGLPVPLVYGTVRLGGSVIGWSNYGNIDIGQWDENTHDDIELQGDVPRRALWVALCAKGEFGSVEEALQGWGGDPPDSWLIIDERTFGIGFEYDWFQFRPDDDIVGGIVFNDGAGNEHPGNHSLGGSIEPNFEKTGPSEPGKYLSKVPGVAHVFLRALYCRPTGGRAPRVSFVVRRTLPHVPLDENDVSYYGPAPGSVIYDIMCDRQHGLGIPDSDIDHVSFNEANDYFVNETNYGLNFAIKAQTEARQVLDQICSMVGCRLYINSEGKYALKAYKPSEPYVAEITDEDIIEFSVVRPSWDDTYNDFRAGGKDREGYYHNSVFPEDFTVREVQVKNIANIEMTGKIRQHPHLDMTAFLDRTVASERLWQLMEDNSWPKAKGHLVTNMQFIYLRPGDVIKITYTPFAMSDNHYFRIVRMDIPEIESNELSFELVEVAAANGLADTGGGTEFEPTEIAFEDFDHVKIWELPYIKNEFPYLPFAALRGSYTPSYLVLISKNDSTDHIPEGFQIALSNDGGTSYRAQTNVFGFSLRGELSEDYPPMAYIENDFDDGIDSLWASSDDVTPPNIAFQDYPTTLVGGETIAYEGGTGTNLTCITVPEETFWGGFDIEWAWVLVTDTDNTSEKTRVYSGDESTPSLEAQARWFNDAITFSATDSAPYGDYVNAPFSSGATYRVRLVRGGTLSTSGIFVPTLDGSDDDNIRCYYYDDFISASGVGYVGGTGTDTWLEHPNSPIVYDGAWWLGAEGATHHGKSYINLWSEFGMPEGYELTVEGGTYEIDDDFGILFTPDNEALASALSDLSRADLFNRPRLALIDDELMAFQTITPEGPTDYRLGGIIRNLAWTERVRHYEGDEIWIFGEEICTNRFWFQSALPSFHIKALPFSAGGRYIMDASDATAHEVTAEFKAKTPQACRVLATRSGSTVTITWWPVTYERNDSAGAQDADSYTDQYPFVREGDFKTQKDSDPESYTTDITTTVTDASAFSFAVTMRNQGYEGPEVSVYVDTSDGDYVSWT